MHLEVNHFPDNPRVNIPMFPTLDGSAVRKCPEGSPWASAESSPNSPGDSTMHLRYPLVMTNIANWKITIFNRQSHYK